MCIGIECLSVGDHRRCGLNGMSSSIPSVLADKEAVNQEANCYKKRADKCDPDLV